MLSFFSLIEMNCETDTRKDSKHKAEHQFENVLFLKEP